MAALDQEGATGRAASYTPAHNVALCGGVINPWLMLSDEQVDAKLSETESLELRCSSGREQPPFLDTCAFRGVALITCLFPQLALGMFPYPQVSSSPPKPCDHACPVSSLHLK